MSYLKAISFIISAIFFGFYIKRLKRVADNLRVKEQDMIYTLSILLLFYNDPFYAIVLVRPSIFK